MKLNGFVGKGSGKLGSSVFAISGGEQIVREYNPRVANPNTDAQVEQRAKLKLMSQLAAALAPGLGFKKMGLISARNQFIAKNIGLCTYANGEAHAVLPQLQLTGGNLVFPTIDCTIGQDNKMTITNESLISSDIKKVVIVICRLEGERKLDVAKVEIVDVPQTQNISVEYNTETGGSFYVFAYGWKPTSSKNNVVYDDYEATMSPEEATLNVNMTTMLQTGVFTATTGNSANA